MHSKKSKIIIMTDNQHKHKHFKEMTYSQLLVIELSEIVVVVVWLVVWLSLTHKNHNIN